MNVLVIRLSALGDVAMTIPAVYSVAKAYPQHHFTVLTSDFMSNLFIAPPSNVEVIALSKADCHGVKGTLRMLRKVSRMKVDRVADLHNVLRSWIIDAFFALKFKRVKMLAKNRNQRKATLVAHRQAQLFTQRYFDVFARLGLSCKPLFSSLFATPAPLPLPIHKANEHWVGIAPFARYVNKIYPLPQMQEVVRLLAACPETRIFLFGTRGKEKETLEQWASEFPNVDCVAGRFSLQEELALMAHLDVMVSMDSANMHLASLVATRVVSVWGATSPLCGFMGWQQRSEDAVLLQCDCQPCSIAGSNHCKRGDFHCLTSLTPDKVCARIREIINK